MINIQSMSTSPLIIQTNTSWNQPSVTGAIQWNGASKCLEVSTGSGWQRIDTTVTLDTAPDVQNILHWVKEKMKEEQELKELAESNITIKDLLNTVNDANEKIKIVKALIQADVKV